MSAKWTHACVCVEHDVNTLALELPRESFMCGCCAAQIEDFDKWTKIPRHERLHVVASNKFEHNGFRAWQFMCYPDLTSPMAEFVTMKPREFCKCSKEATCFDDELMCADCCPNCTGR